MPGGAAAESFCVRSGAQCGGFVWLGPGRAPDASTLHGWREDHTTSPCCNAAEACFARDLLRSECRRACPASYESPDGLPWLCSVPSPLAPPAPLAPSPISPPPRPPCVSSDLINYDTEAANCVGTNGCCERPTAHCFLRDASGLWGECHDRCPHSHWNCTMISDRTVPPPPAAPLPPRPPPSRPPHPPPPPSTSPHSAPLLRHSPARAKQLKTLPPLLLPSQFLPPPPPLERGRPLHMPLQQSAPTGEAAAAAHAPQDPAYDKPDMAGATRTIGGAPLVVVGGSMVLLAAAALALVLRRRGPGSRPRAPHRKLRDSACCARVVADPAVEADEDADEPEAIPAASMPPLASPDAPSCGGAAVPRQGGLGDPGPQRGARAANRGVAESLLDGELD